MHRNTHTWIYMCACVPTEAVGTRDTHAKVIPDFSPCLFTPQRGPSGVVPTATEFQVVFEGDKLCHNQGVHSGSFRTFLFM